MTRSAWANAFDSVCFDVFVSLYYERFWAQVAIAALLTREHWRWLNYGGLNGPGMGEI